MIESYIDHCPSTVQGWLHRIEIQICIVRNAILFSCRRGHFKISPGWHEIAIPQLDGTRLGTRHFLTLPCPDLTMASAPRDQVGAYTIVNIPGLYSRIIQIFTHSFFYFGSSSIAHSGTSRNAILLHTDVYLGPQPPHHKLPSANSEGRHIRGGRRE